MRGHAQRKGRGRRLRAVRWGATVSTAVLVQLALGAPIQGAGGVGGVADGGGDTPVILAGASGTSAYVTCMRSHRVAHYPRPTRSEKLGRVSPAQLGVTPATLHSAEAACRHLLPDASGPTSRQVRQYRDTMLKYARCMRGHGLAQFPDPDSMGRLAIGPGTDVPVNTPAFQSAFNSCKHLFSAGNT